MEQREDRGKTLKDSIAPLKPATSSEKCNGSSVIFLLNKEGDSGIHTECKYLRSPKFQMASILPASATQSAHFPSTLSRMPTRKRYCARSMVI